jgi:hypothetical protein
MVSLHMATAGNLLLFMRPPDREAFLKAIAQLEHERRRDGAYAWGRFHLAGAPKVTHFIAPEF